MAWNSKIPYCSECGGYHYFSDPHVSPSDLADTPLESKPVEVAPPVEQGDVDPGGASGYARQKRWREKNREAYNAYMREYRRKKSDG
jgi:hypothetical protein